MQPQTRLPFVLKIAGWRPSVYQRYGRFGWATLSPPPFGISLPQHDTFSFFTTSGGGDTFDPEITKPTGGEARWTLGPDGDEVGNSISHEFADDTQKTIVLTVDNFNFVTAIDFQDDKIKGLLNLEEFGMLVDIQLGINPDLTGVVFPAHDNLMTRVLVANCGLSGVVDLTGLTRLAGTVRFNNSTMSDILFPDSSEDINVLYVFQSGLSGTLDISGLTGLGGVIAAYQSGSLQNVTFPLTSRSITLFYFFSCDLTGIFDISPLTGLGGNVNISSNPNLTSIVNPASSNNITNYQVNGCDLTTLDVSGLTSLSGTFYAYLNPSLEQIVWPASVNIATLYAYNCNIGYDSAWIPILKTNLGNFRIQNNALSQADVDSWINDIYSNRSDFKSAAKTLNISGDNAAPSGSFQAPAGYIQADEVTAGDDGAPETAKEQMYVLVNQNIDNTTDKKYNWTITSN